MYLQKILENDYRFINNLEYKFKSKLKLIYNNSTIDNDNILDSIPASIDITNIYNHNISTFEKKNQSSKTPNINIQINKSNINESNINDSNINEKYKELKNKYKNHLIEEYNFNELISNNISDNNNKLLILKDMLLKLSSK